MQTTAQLWGEIEGYRVREGAVCFWWLYQAGIVLKSPGGTMVAIDPYLSDAARRSYDQPRNVAAPLDPTQVRLDAVLASHSHEDHLDPDSIAGFAGYAPTRFIGPPMVTARVVATGVDPGRTETLARGDHTSVGDMTVRAVHARHPFDPEPVPDAIGYVIACGDVSIYHSGDTEYDSEIVADASGVTASFVAINGTAGNMNAHEAALLAWRQGTRLAVPFHYGLWRDAGYGEGATIDPQLFVDTYEHLAGGGRTLVLEAGRAYELDGRGAVA